MGYASAIGVVLFLLTLVFSLINLRFLREKT
jgi:ABC-type sugar transport system permease subunit